jgi:hypothetical protein
MGLLSLCVCRPCALGGTWAAVPPAICTSVAATNNLHSWFTSFLPWEYSLAVDYLVRWLPKWHVLSSDLLHPACW